MSLIHDALKTVDGVAPSVALPRVTAPAPTAAKPATGWLGGLAAFALVLAAGGGAYWLWLGTQPVAQRAGLAQPQPLAQTPPPVAAQVPTPVPSQVMGSPAAAPAQDALTAAAATPASATAKNDDQKVPPTLDIKVVNAIKTGKPASVSAAVGASAGAVRTASATGAARPIRRAPVKPVPKPAPVAEPVDDTPVELRFARFVAAMRVNDVAGADVELAALRKRLPEGALGLVRAQAWFDLRNGREDAALAGYQTILDRLPGDEEAAINVASVHSHRQQGEQARGVLAAAVRVNPDSVALRNALNQFAPAGRP